MGQLIKVKDKNGKYVLKVVNSSQPMYIVNNKKRKEQFNQTQKKDTWFQKGAFSDGYDIGDIAKTILGTTSDVGINIGKGIVNAGEGLGKMMVGGVAELSEALGNKEYSNKLKNRLAGKDENFNKKREKYLFSSNLDKLENKIDKFSLTGEKTDNIATGLGNIGASIAGQSVGIPWYATMGGSSVGHELENAYSNDATDQEAWISAGISGLSEVIFEKLSGGIKFGGKTLDESIKRPLLNKISNQTVKTLSNYGIDMFGEGAEEVLTEIASNVGRKLTYKSEETWKTALASEEALNSYIESFISGALVSGIINSGKTYQIVKESKRKQIQEQELINIEQSKQELENNFQNGIITEEQYEQEINNLSNRLKTFTQEIHTNKVNPITEIEVEKQLLDEQFNNNLITEEEYNNSLSSLDESLKELSNNNQTLTNPNKIEIFRETANEYWDNSKESQEVKNLIEKVIKDKDYNIILDPTIGNNIGGLATTNQNGEVEIRLNTNSNRAVEFLLVHEITHAIETSSMKKFVMNFARKNPNFVRENPTFKNALKSLEQTYNSEDVSSEVLADISGQLLGNQEFINSLAMQNTAESKSIIKTIYEEIKRLLNTLTKDGRYRNFVQDLETKWREAYRTQNNNLHANMYSKQTLSDGTTYIQTEDNLFTKPDGTPMTQREIFNSLVGKTIEFNDGIKATIIKSLPNNKDVYNELFKRYPTYQNVNNIKSVNNKINENIVELLENSDNISPNEPDYMNRHKKNKIKSFDTREVKLYDGNNAYNLTFSIAKLNDGTYVAYAKRNLAKDTDLLNKIKKEAPTSKSRGVLPYTNTIPQSNKNVKSDNVSTKYSIQNNNNNTQELDDSSFSLEKLPKIKEGYTRLYRGLKEKYDANYDRSKLDSPNGYDTLTDNYELAKQYGDNVYYIDIPTNQISNSVIDENPNSETYGDRNLAYKDDKPAGLNGISGNEYLLYTDHDNFNSQDYHEISEKTTNNDTKYSTDNKSWQKFLEDNYKATDNQGRELSPQQQEYFKDSKVRDENGKLLEVYHGTSESFTKFEKEFIGSNYLQDEQGFFFTDDINQAREYADYTSYGMPRKTPGNVMSLYLDIKNPLIVNIDYDPISYWDENYENYLEKANKNNNDGIIIKAQKYQSMYVAFNPNQIKNVDNLNPTTNEDIRYSSNNQTWQKFLEDNYKATGKRTNMADIRRKPNSNTNTNTESQTSQNKNLLPINKEVKKAVEPIKKDITDISKQIAEIRKALGIKVGS